MIFIDKTVFPIAQFEFNYFCQEVNNHEATLLPIGSRLNALDIKCFLYISKDHIGNCFKLIKPEYNYIYFDNKELKICSDEVCLTVDMVEYIYEWTKRLNKFKEEVDLYESIKQLIKKIGLME